MKKFIKLIANLIVTKANKQRWCIELGAFFLNNGVEHKQGDIVYITPIGFKGKHQITTIDNVYYDFTLNKIKYTYSKTIEQLNEKAG